MNKKKATGMPQYRNPPPPPRKTTPKHDVIDDTLTCANNNKKLAAVEEWCCKAFLTNSDARNFMNENGIFPHFIIPKPSGKTEIWWTKQLNSKK